ncbi:MAG TPA: hypothetical protein VKG79_04270 [Bryobacteraceae bacterium]|nr:hypothetical protein [Bryobacteraceae bacterium]
MMAPAIVFTCSICGESSKDICVLCTKDVCANHRCERCKRCSDCCECDVPLSAEELVVAAETPVPVEELQAPAAPAETMEAQTAATGEIPPFLPESFESPREPGE